jgi:hypothetical protein
MNANLRITKLAMLVASTCNCALGLSPMIDYSALRAERQARFFAEGDMLVVQAFNPLGGNLALDPEPSLDQGRVVLVAGVTSSGAEGVKTYCRDLGKLNPSPDWPNRVFWRNRNGELIHIQPIDQGEAAQREVAACRGVRNQMSQPVRSSAVPPNQCRCTSIPPQGHRCRIERADSAAGLQLNDKADGSHFVQSAISKSSKYRKSSVVAVMRVRLSLWAMAAIGPATNGGVLPLSSSRALSRPCHSAAASS